MSFGACSSEHVPERRRQPGARDGAPRRPRTGLVRRRGPIDARVRASPRWHDRVLAGRPPPRCQFAAQRNERRPHRHGPAGLGLQTIGGASRGHPPLTGTSRRDRPASPVSANWNGGTEGTSASRRRVDADHVGIDRHRRATRQPDAASRARRGIGQVARREVDPAARREPRRRAVVGSAVVACAVAPEPAAARAVRRPSSAVRVTAFGEAEASRTARVRADSPRFISRPPRVRQRRHRISRPPANAPAIQFER